MGSDLSYFLQRASEERTAAIQARDVRARESHTQLAEGYEDIVRRITANLPPRNVNRVRPRALQRVDDLIGA